MEDEGAEETLRTARTVVAVLSAAPVLLGAIAAAVPLEPSLGSLATPAVLAGIVAPAAGFHLYRKLQQAASREADVRGRAAAFVRATVLALACTEAAATFGVVAFLLSREPVCLLAIALHLLLAGAVWPSRERLESFVATGEGRG
jgi:hypothetical protein